MRTDVILALLPLAAALPSATNKRETPAPILRPRGAKLIEGKYIVKMRSGAVKAAVGMAVSAIKGDADWVFDRPKFSGFVSTLSDLELKSLQDDPNVDYIEQDAIITIKSTATQPKAPWGLARISSTKPGTTSYVYDSSAGAGTCAYIVDTGIEVKHKEFEGRAKWLANFADKNNTDGLGHGTHVAGTIGSKTYGVAKKTQLFAVKVLDQNGEGTNSQVIAGMDFVVTDAPKQNCPKGVVVNMSLGGSTSAAVNAAAAGIVDAGHFLAVAAGNESEDAKNSSPASEKSVCTVGATTKVDKLAEYSNFGAGVDVLAPGSEILSTWIGGKTNTISGTSMATPHVAGLGAYLLGLGNAPKDPEELCAYMAKTALSGVIGGVPKATVNLLINNGGNPGSNSTAPVKGRPGRTSV